MYQQLKSFIGSVLLSVLLSSCAQISSYNRPTSARQIYQQPLVDFIAKYPDLSGHILVADSNRVLVSFAFGRAKPDTKMSINARWRYASITKQLVAVAIMQMIEEGLITLETSVNKIFLEAPLPIDDRVTVLNLLQHT